jgi:hypothetical protein
MFFERDRLQSAALRLGKGEADLAIVAGGRFDLLHAIDLLQLALRLRGLRVLGAEAVHELHQVRDLALLVFVGREQLFLGGFALDEVVVVVAAIPDEFALADLHDAATSWLRNSRSCEMTRIAPG